MNKWFFSRFPGISQHIHFIFFIICNLFTLYHLSIICQQISRLNGFLWQKYLCCIFWYEIFIWTHKTAKTIFPVKKTALSRSFTTTTKLSCIKFMTASAGKALPTGPFRQAVIYHLSHWTDTALRKLFQGRLFHLSDRRCHCGCQGLPVCCHPSQTACLSARCTPCGILYSTRLRLQLDLWCTVLSIAHRSDKHHNLWSQ